MSKFMRLIALDLETDGLDARHNPNKRVWCGGLSWYGNDGSIKSWAGTWEQFKLRVLRLLEDKNVQFVVHNASFDIAVLRIRGVNIELGRYHDSMLLAYVADPGSDVSLETLSGTKFDVHSALVNAGCIEDNKGAEWKLDYGTDPKAMAILTHYCAKDCEAALATFTKVWQQHYETDDKLRRSYLELELPYVECIIDMEQTGLYIDQQKLQSLKRNLERRLWAIDIQLKRLVPYVPELTWDADKKAYVAVPVEYAKGFYKNKTNVPKQYYIDASDRLLSSAPDTVYNHCKLEDFNMNSSRHLCWVLMNEGWKPSVYSKKTGEPKTDSEVMETISNDYKLARLYSCHSLYSKLLGTFVEGIENALDNNGYAHGSFNQTVTKTTRLSSSNPNLQNLPARSALGLKVRQCVIAPDGYALAVADLDQVELRILAYYLEKVVGESRMADAARLRLDAHQANADAWGASRKLAKGGIFAVNYGAMAARLAKSLKITEKAAQELIDGINAGMPAIQALKEKVWGNLTVNRPGVKLYDGEGHQRSDGVIYTLFGSRIFYPLHNHRQEWRRSKARRQAFNALIQGTGANINKELSIRAMAVLRKYGCRMAAAVHDEVLIYIPLQHVEVVLTELNRIYDNSDILVTPKGFVPVTGNWAVGKDWVEAKGA